MHDEIDDIAPIIPQMYFIPHLHTFNLKILFSVLDLHHHIGLLVKLPNYSFRLQKCTSRILWRIDRTLWSIARLWTKQPSIGHETLREHVSEPNILKYNAIYCLWGKFDIHLWSLWPMHKIYSQRSFLVSSIL